MAYVNYQMAKKLREKAKAEKENRAAKIALDLYERGVISHTSQRQISGDALRAAWENYVNGELSRQAVKGSTGTFGKAADSFNRCRKAWARKLPLEITDVACRPAGQPDITIQCDEEAAEMLEKSRITVELKSGGGVIANGISIDECWQVIADACEAGKWIAWYIDPTLMGWERFDENPCIFLPMDELIYHLEAFKGDITTWFKVNGETMINFQTISNSEKKRSWLYHIYDRYSYDWPTFRDTGKLVKVRDN